MMEKTIKELLKAIKSSDTKKTNPYDTSATVTRVENGVAYVHIPGGVDETPVKLTVNVQAGDEVQVRVGGGQAWITGNETAPPTDDKVANVAAETAIDAAKTAAEAGNAAASAAQAADTAWHHADEAASAAESAQNSLKSVVAGAVTVEKAVSVMQTALEAVVDYDPSTDTTKEYFWHDANGAHVLGTSGDYRNDIDSTGMKIVDTSTENSVATFGTETSIRTSDGTELAHFGYALGPAQSGTAVAPYYTLGTRQSGGYDNGNYSFASGWNNIASKFAATAMGNGTIASGNSSTAMGASSSASGIYSTAMGLLTRATAHSATAMGLETTASETAATAMGHYTVAAGEHSTAMGSYTVVNRANNTVIGQYNAATVTEDALGHKIYSDVGDYPFIIGNGTNDTTAARSNALTVDWDGNVKAAGALTASNIGAVRTASGTAPATIAAWTWTTLCTLSLTAGTYLVYSYIYDGPYNEDTLVRLLTWENNVQVQRQMNMSGNSSFGANAVVPGVFNASSTQTVALLVGNSNALNNTPSPYKGDIIAVRIK